MHAPYARGRRRRLSAARRGRGAPHPGCTTRGAPSPLAARRPPAPPPGSPASPSHAQKPAHGRTAWGLSRPGPLRGCAVRKPGGQCVYRRRQRACVRAECTMAVGPCDGLGWPGTCGHMCAMRAALCVARITGLRCWAGGACRSALTLHQSSMQREFTPRLTAGTACLHHVYPGGNGTGRRGPGGGYS